MSEYLEILKELRDEEITRGDMYASLNEASMTRIWDRVQEEQLDFAIMTAYRKGNSKEKNVALNRDLRAELNSNKLGVYSLVGHWKEAPDEYADDYDLCPEELKFDTLERSYLIVRNKLTPEDFAELILKLAKKYKQDSVVLRVYMMNMNGVYSPSGVEYDKFKSTHLDLGRVARAYSQYVKKMNCPFVFEGIEEPDCIGYGKKAFSDSGFIW